MKPYGLTLFTVLRLFPKTPQEKFLYHVIESRSYARVYIKRKGRKGVRVSYVFNELRTLRSGLRFLRSTNGKGRNNALATNQAAPCSQKRQRSHGRARYAAISSDSYSEPCFSSLFGNHRFFEQHLGVLMYVLQKQRGRFRTALCGEPQGVRRYSLQCRATNAAGETQTTYEWNHGGYCRNVIQTIDVEVGA